MVKGQGEFEKKENMYNHASVMSTSSQKWTSLA